MKSFETCISDALGQSQRGKTYLAAVSGGADSTAMLIGLAKLRKEADFNVHCVHVEHGIRPAEESCGDAGAVELLCKKLEVPCRVIAIPPGKIAAAAGSGGPGIEGAARFYRMRILQRERCRMGAEKILIAHTRDDLLETLLMRILMGSGPAGLAPMPRSRGNILRPILDLTRNDVLAYLEKKGMPHRTDSTNTDIRFLRNRIRQKLIPFLDKNFPFWKSSLLALAETQSLAADFLSSETFRLVPWEKCSSGEDSGAGGQGRVYLRIHEEDFLKAPPIIREEAVFAGTDMLAAEASAGKFRRSAAVPQRVAAVPRRTAVRSAIGRQDGLSSDLGPVRLEKRNSFITLTPVSRQKEESGFSLLINGPGAYFIKGSVMGMENNLSIRFPDPDDSPPGGYQFPMEAVLSTAAGKAACLYVNSFPLVFRSHRAGDCIFRGGHRRSFSDILDKETRSGYTGLITACDTEGTAAIIGLGGNGDIIVTTRDKVWQGTAETGIFIGGKDV